MEITPELDIRPDYAIVNRVFHRVIKAVGYPRKVEDGWLEAFLASSEPYDISLHIHPAAITSTLVLLHNQIIKQTTDLASSTAKGTPNPSLEIKLGDTTRVYEELYRGEEKMFRVSLYVDNQTLNEEALDLLTEKCKANMNAQLIIPKTVDYRMAEGIKSMLPQAIDAIGTQKEFLTSSLSATFPFLYPVNSRKEGLFFGQEANTLNPLFIDFESMSNKHFFVLGISGSGKSYASKFLVMQHRLSQKTKVYVLDPNAEYSGLAAKMNGEIVRLSKDSDSIINLFDLAGEDFGSKMLTLISVFDIITGGLTESQKSVLNDALLRVYAKKGIDSIDSRTWKNHPPTFSDLKKVFDTMLKRVKRNPFSDVKSIESLASRVRMYSEKGFFAFLDKQTKLNLDKDFIDFDLSALPPQVKQLVMFAVLELISREIKKDKNPKVVLIDEGWSLLRSKEAENYVLEFIKTSRKYNASIGFITQEIEDLLRSDGGKSILNTTSTKILLKQNPSNLDLIARNLALNDNEKNHLLQAGKGEGLLITEHGRYEFKINTPPKIHSLITTDPNDTPAVAKKKEEPVVAKPEVKIDLEKGFYLANSVSEEQKDVLTKNDYVLYKSRLTNAGGSSYFYVKRQGRESKEHSLLCWYIADEIRKRGGKPVVCASVEPDVSVETKKRKFCFEVETGEVLASHGSDYIKEKISGRAKEFKPVIIVVSSWKLRLVYASITGVEVITRAEVPAKVKSLL